MEIFISFLPYPLPMVSPIINVAFAHFLFPASRLKKERAQNSCFCFQWAGCSIGLYTNLPYVLVDSVRSLAPHISDRPHT